MVFIEDLGMKYPTESSKRKRHFGLYLCNICGSHFERQIYHGSHIEETKCRSCASYENSKIAAIQRIELAKNTFISVSQKVHNFKYDYTLTNYIDSSTLVEITCVIHGSFWQNPSNHKSGTGCPKCGTEHATNIKIQKAADTFIEVADKQHDHKYDYSLIDYKDKNSYIQIICSKHGIFEQSPDNHKRGRGCPKCASYGFNPGKPAIMYYIKVVLEGVKLYKIGITNSSVETRFKKYEISKIYIIKIWEFPLGADALAKEQEILETYQEFKYLGESVLSSGNTELFTKDILQLDKETIYDSN